LRDVYDSQNQQDAPLERDVLENAEGDDPPAPTVTN
jgi:hypothetical protein